MADEQDYEAARQLNIYRNQTLIRELGLTPLESKSKRIATKREAKANKKQKSPDVVKEPKRASARLAAIQRASRGSTDRSLSSKDTKDQADPSGRSAATGHQISSAPSIAPSNAAAIVRGWTDWKPVASEPSRDEEGVLHFDSWPDFLPNKSPAEIIREGAFGGSFFRPLLSKRLGIVVRDDWRELPESWLNGLNLERYVCCSKYNPDVNKYGVSCGQSIEQWEASGWIVHEYDVRGWFQWYCRFYLGRRCDDDTRQVGRWARCVGQKGRWRRVLLKQYVERGIRNVMDEEGGEGGLEGEVSPVVSQTCLHWAWEPRQKDLDAAWKEFR